MKKLLALVACLFLSWNTYAQNQTISPLNLSFEETENNLPKGWYISGSPSYKANIDAKIVQNGRNALLIEGNGGYKIITLGLPHNYTGKKITFSGYIKTENISDGQAALWMRIDPKIAFDNMQDRGIKGTTDWQKAEITLSLNPEATDQILIGAMLSGSGKMWIDNFKVTIDGTDIKDAKFIIKTVDQKEALDTLNSIIEATKNNSIYKNNVNWNELIPEVKKALNPNANNVFNAVKPAVALMLDKLNDNHSFLKSKNASVGRLNPVNLYSRVNQETMEALNTSKGSINIQKLEKKIGYISIPGMSTSQKDGEREEQVKKLGQALRDSLCKLNLKDLKGIIVDLRLNTGGNMYPMISGIAPLLGNGKAGSFVDNGKILNSWSVKDGSLLINDNEYITLQNNCNPGKNIKIALLIGPATASSGEATAISFIGKKNVKLIGEKTTGLVSANNSIKISEDLYYLLSSSYEADRNNKEYKESILPDVEITGGDNFKDLLKDKKILSAIQWIKQ
ncbi:protease/peptidase [Elizabethkingia anophelis]|nr:protease/peptidase [Elizabethkingia anophelis]MDV3770825.1 protease/peptidase [Elizabethkingia anophelis]MDV3775439.1 protease/peptidase [Elizabethkingia anophelis]MDV3841920.1 protease/peptidase [Elizabethkingia anophelis]